MMKRLLLVFVFLLGLIWAVPQAQAHMLWLNAKDYLCEPGEPVWVEVGWGHHYPRDQAIGRDQLKQTYIIGPGGKKVDPEFIFPGFFTFTPPEPGCYRVVSELRPGFLSKTPRGHKRGNKKDLDKVISCFRYKMNAGLVVHAGQERKGFCPRAEQDLTITAMEDSADWKREGALSLKVLFKGEPLANAQIQGAYAGHAEGGDHDHHWAVKKSTDEKGIARISLTSHGPWMFMVRHITAYPDQRECDKNNYFTSLVVGLE